MAFFDETFQNAKKVYELFENKTITTVEVQKLKLKALKIDNELSKIYEKLGRLYVKELKFRENLPEELALILESVAAKKAEIETIKEQIAAFKGGVACGECGYLNDSNVDYCAKCGAEL